MRNDPGDVQVTRDDDRNRYVLTVDGQEAGFAAYRPAGDLVVFTHTEVFPRWEGFGLGTVLVRYALDDVVSGGRRFEPLCPFVAAVVNRHPEYADHLAA